MSEIKKNKVGRPPGRANRVTTSTRFWLNNLIQKNMETFEDDLQELEAKDRVNVFINLLKFTTPQLKAVENNINFNELTETQIDLIIDEITKDI